MNHREEKLMDSPTSEEVTEKSLAAKSAVDSDVRDFEDESTKSAHTTHSKVGIDAERIRSSIARLTSNSSSVLDGIGIIIEAIAPWKTAGLGSAPRANGRDKLKRWP